MKPSTILFTLFLCLHFFPLTLLSQDSIQYRKLYLHTDKEHYFLGDTLWYKGYYLDWQPNIFTEKGKASVSFYSSDDISRYRVYVEGITSEGKICLGTASFEVDKRNDQLAGH